MGAIGRIKRSIIGVEDHIGRRAGKHRRIVRIQHTRQRPARTAVAGKIKTDRIAVEVGAFFGAHVLPPGVYVPRDGFDEPGTSLREPYAGQAELTGRALAELAAFLPQTRSLRLLEPQA